MAVLIHNGIQVDGDNLPAGIDAKDCQTWDEFRKKPAAFKPAEVADPTPTQTIEVAEASTPVAAKKTAAAKSKD